MFDTVLVANRGEIAVRIMSTLRRLGIRSVAVYSDADAGARHVREADVAVRIGPARATESYLHMGRILEAAARCGAQAIHPGYGFLSENTAFVRACEDVGVVFIGPDAEAVEVMGDKIRAKVAVAAAGVPVVPGRTASAMTDADLAAAATEIGYPVIIKPSAGGGGKGMHLVESPDRLADAVTGARREAAASFGDDTLFVERLVARPRHIEVQILADGYGTTLHLGERECSLQRRHQKVIEEAPSVFLDGPTRARIGALAVETARSVGYRGVGTVEFIVSSDAPDEFYFMEMNTRLQVEHPVTELITGLDLVEQQLRVAAGEHLGFGQDDVCLHGHAIEARIYAEDPARGFVPTGGEVLAYEEPSGDGIRVDSALAEGTEIDANYDPMLAKVIAFGPDRKSALARLDRALASTVALGVTTNTAFLRALLAHPEVVAGRLDTGLIERDLDALVTDIPVGAPSSLELGAVFALSSLIAAQPTGPVFDRFDVPDGWRLGDVAATEWTVVTQDNLPLEIAITGTPENAIVTVDGCKVACALVGTGAEVQSGRGVSLISGTGSQHGTRRWYATVDGRTWPVRTAVGGEITWLWMDGVTHALRVRGPARRNEGAGPSDGELRSPMPGVVIDLQATVGESVEKGERLVVIEAMKMEHALVAPFPGLVAEVHVSAGDQVVVGEPLVRVDPVLVDADACSTAPGVPPSPGKTHP